MAALVLGVVHALAGICFLGELLARLMVSISIAIPGMAIVPAGHKTVNTHAIKTEPPLSVSQFKAITVTIKQLNEDPHATSAVKEKDT